eukprot:TRINITY_DN20_c0_g2_i1.p1 TRINITY_DN20_c0_g2~~TRINITY_DN20_c0_g2_i1.p1  ORF type:complete len:125 (-),score=63.34 TRINITY_DN20_c0_g2_i1:147-521(-)
MKDIAAYLLLVLGGNNNPTADDITKLLGSVGASPSDNLQKLLEELQGKTLSEVLAAGEAKLAAAGPMVAAGSGSGSGEKADSGVADAEPEEEEEEESDAEGGMGGLFGGGGSDDSDSDGGFGMF